MLSCRTVFRFIYKKVNIMNIITFVLTLIVIFAGAKFIFMPGSSNFRTSHKPNQRNVNSSSSCGDFITGVVVGGIISHMQHDKPDCQHVDSINFERSDISSGNVDNDCSSSNYDASDSGGDTSSF